MHAQRSILFVALGVLIVSQGVYAEVYRWTDERGVTNYGNAPPPRGASGVQRVPDQLSRYTPDAALTAAIARDRERMLRAEETARLQRELERRGAIASPAVTPLPAPVPVYDDAYSYYGYAPGIVTVPIYRRPPLRQATIPPGTQAGQSVSPWEGYIPGNSAGAYAGRQSPVMSRPAAPRTR